MNYEVFKTPADRQKMDQERLVDFLYEHLQPYGDSKKDIGAAIDYAFDPGRGGLVIKAVEDGTVTGAAVVNRTGMKGYIPENILVYIAVHQSRRGNGIGRQLMEKIMEETEGSVALHVEPDNPAKRLYEKLGFTNKYLEMRLNR